MNYSALLVATFAAMAAAAPFTPLKLPLVGPDRDAPKATDGASSFCDFTLEYLRWHLQAGRVNGVVASLVTSSTNSGSAENGPARPTSSDAAANGSSGGGGSGKVGPHPGFIFSSNQYSSETKVRRMLKDNGCDPAREDNYRLQGVQLIDNVRKHLNLPVRTFDTACTYFHKFRLNFRDAEYNYQDAALASLFVACKVEDTIKKSKDILAAAYNVRNPDKPSAPDDKIFESPGRIIIGLERLILETIGFDFRTRYPQKLLVKVVRRILGKDRGTSFYNTAYAMCIDMYKTFIPIKRSTFSMVMAVVELTARMRGEHLDKVQDFAAQRRQYDRGAVMETMLDLLDLYVQHHKSTKIGAEFDLNKFIDIKIHLNKDLDDSAQSRYLYHCNRCEIEDPRPSSPGLATSPTASAAAAIAAPWSAEASVRRSARGQDGTMRFVFDPETAQAERSTVGTYFHEEFEDPINITITMGTKVADLEGAAEAEAGIVEATETEGITEGVGLTGTEATDTTEEGKGGIIEI
ncbi:CTD kinase subunit beta [Paramyrothecium foliicola]|nr:CTD kinase subunit beta [Paramyrothecium foliicola]